MTGQNQEPALAERHAVLCECLLQGRSAFGPTPCSLASSAAGTSASRLSRVYPAAVSARVAGAPILPGRPASRDVMYRIVPASGPRSRREDVPKTAPHHQPQDALFCCLSSGQADIPDPGSRVGVQAAEVLMRPTSCASMGGTRSATSGKLRRVLPQPAVVDRSPLDSAGYG